MTVSEKPATSQTVAVTGGAGFLGSYILRVLLGAGYHVKALQNRTKITLSHDRLEIVQGGLLDDAALERLVSGCDVVVHAAGLVAARTKEMFFLVNQAGTDKLFNISRKNDIARFLCVSSIAARAPNLSAYAASKRTGEDVIIDEDGHETGWDIVRPPAIYGPGDEQFLPLFALLQKRIGVLPAGKKARVSIIHAQDMAAAVCCWVESGKTTQKIYEVDDGKAGGYLWQDILGCAAGILDVSPRYFVPPRLLLMGAAALIQGAAFLKGRTPFTTPGKIRELCHKDWVASRQGFADAFAWQSEISLEDGLKQTLQHYREAGLL